MNTENKLKETIERKDNILMDLYLKLSNICDTIQDKFGNNVSDNFSKFDYDVLMSRLDDLEKEVNNL